MSAPDQARGPDPLLRLTVGLAIVGLIGVQPLLWFGFTPWTMGFGMFPGFPALGLSIALYGVIVIRDLRRHGLV